MSIEILDLSATTKTCLSLTHSLILRTYHELIFFGITFYWKLLSCCCMLMT